MSTVWDRTAEFLSDNLASLTPIVLLGLFAPLSLLGSLKPLVGTIAGAGNMTLLAVLLVLSLISAWAGLAITALAFDPAGGRNDAMRVANQRFLPAIGLGIVTLLIVVLLALPILLALALGGVDLAMLAGKRSSAGAVNGGAVAFAVLYGFVLLPFLLFVYARFFVLVTPIVVMERRGLGVFARSFVLTRTIAWKVIGVLLLYLVVSTVAGLAAKAVFGLVFTLLVGGDGPLSLASVLTQIVAAGVSTIFSVLAIAFVAKLYLASRDAREAIVEAA